jgi:hypothetical protein
LPDEDLDALARILPKLGGTAEIPAPAVQRRARNRRSHTTAATGSPYMSPPLDSGVARAESRNDEARSSITSPRPGRPGACRRRGRRAG